MQADCLRGTPLTPQSRGPGAEGRRVRVVRASREILDGQNRREMLVAIQADGCWVLLADWFIVNRANPNQALTGLSSGPQADADWDLGSRLSQINTALRRIEEMPELHWCWRCRTAMPMLTDQEWEQVAPLLRQMTSQIQSYRERTGANLEAAIRLGYEQPALTKYRELTGFEETNVSALWHHRLSNYGPPCRHCGKLLRTDAARRCFECGHDAP
jgi:hypothetical protein